MMMNDDTFKQLHQRSRVGQAGKLYKSYIGLTDERCSDIEDMLDRKVINKNTHITIVERLKSVHKKICDRFNKKKYVNQYKIVNDKLEKFDTNKCFDLVNIDLYGAIHGELLDWICNLPLLANADLYINSSKPRSKEHLQFRSSLSEFFNYTADGSVCSARIKRKYNLNIINSDIDTLNIVMASINVMQSKYDFDFVLGQPYADYVVTMHPIEFLNIHAVELEREPILYSLPESIYVSSYNTHYERKGRLVGKTLTEQMAIVAIDGSIGEKRFVETQKRKQIAKRVLHGFNAKDVEAGLKSAATKILQKK